MSLLTCADSEVLSQKHPWKGLGWGHQVHSSTVLVMMVNKTAQSCSATNTILFLFLAVIQERQGSRSCQRLSRKLLIFLPSGWHLTFSEQYWVCAISWSQLQNEIRLGDNLDHDLPLLWLRGQGIWISLGNLAPDKSTVPPLKNIILPSQRLGSLFILNAFLE